MSFFISNFCKATHDYSVVFQFYSRTFKNKLKNLQTQSSATKIMRIYYKHATSICLTISCCEQNLVKNININHISQKVKQFSQKLPIAMTSNSLNTWEQMFHVIIAETILTVATSFSQPFIIFPIITCTFVRYRENANAILLQFQSLKGHLKDTHQMFCHFVALKQGPVGYNNILITKLCSQH